MQFATLHVRLTRDCNADCSYCSSATSNHGRMSPDDFAAALDFIIARVFPRMKISKSHHLTVEFLGGEVLLVPDEEFSRCLAIAEEKLAPLVAGYRAGAQSNLIGAQRRILALSDAVEGRIGTSWDPFSDERKVAGSADLYRKMMGASLNTLKDQRGITPGRVLVVDSHTCRRLPEAIAMAREDGADLVLRPVFSGASEIAPATLPDLVDAFAAGFLEWSKLPSHRVEPFYSLARRRIGRGVSQGPYAFARQAGCPFQSDCAMKSLSLDPDGALFICQEMADSENYQLGNALHGSFDESTWRLLARRSAHLSSECSICPWKTECSGGCMNEGILHHGDPFARTEFCAIWKRIFSLIEDQISQGDLDFNALEDRQKERQP